MKKLLLLLFLLLNAGVLFSQQDYFPPKGAWKKQSPLKSGFDTAKLNAAIRFAIKNESKNPRSMELSQKMSFGKEPFGEAIGPFADRGDPTGIIIHRGYIVAEWGEPSRVDMVHSVSKSFLSTIVGVAVDKGVIAGIDNGVNASVWAVQLYDSTKPVNSDPVFFYPFKGEHNVKISWEDMLRQTSDWEGTLWGKPDWADRPAQDPAEWRTRKRAQPGTTYEYNDVRVNVLALAATNVWRRPLPEVLRDNIMDPIGASASWRWFGYDNAWITLDGRPVQIVSGGGHWGGGMFINAWDMARFGLLTLRRGMWGDKRILSEAWVKMALTPTAPQPTYGFMNWFLNTDRKWMPSAPPNAFGHVGNGTNLVFVSPDQDLVAVVRWIDNASIDPFLAKLLGAVVK